MIQLNLIFVLSFFIGGLGGVLGTHIYYTQHPMTVTKYITTEKLEEIKRFEVISVDKKQTDSFVKYRSFVKDYYPDPVNIQTGAVFEVRRDLTYYVYYIKKDSTRISTVYEQLKKKFYN